MLYISQNMLQLQEKDKKETNKNNHNNKQTKNRHMKYINFATFKQIFYIAVASGQFGNQGSVI